MHTRAAEPNKAQPAAPRLPVGILRDPTDAIYVPKDGQEAHTGKKLGASWTDRGNDAGYFAASTRSVLQRDRWRAMPTGERKQCWSQEAGGCGIGPRAGAHARSWRMH